MFYFYAALTQLAVCSTVPKLEKKRMLQKVLNNQKKMKKWAHHAPMNFLHKYYLVEAERNRVVGKDIKAMNQYDRAIELAKENQYLNDEALANELAAKFYLAKGKIKIAQTYMQEARYCYLKWGATAKVKHLEETYPQLFHIMPQNPAGNSQVQSNHLPTTTDSGKALDVTSVLKASQAISGEIILEKSLAKLMKIMIENAGAQKGVLILEKSGELFIEATGSVESDEFTVLQSVPLENNLPVSLVNYVARARETVVLDEAYREQRFNQDAYIAANQTQSILCVPLINQGKLISIVYLENNLTVGAFTEERRKVITLLSAQAAISIENAKLYSELRENESRLMQFLEAVPVGILVLDRTGTPYYANYAAQQMFGKGIESVAPDKLTEVYRLYCTNSDRLYPTEQLSSVQALQGLSSTVSNLEIHRGDRIIPIESWGTPIFDEQGNVVYAIAAFQDITDRKKAEAERLKLTNDLLQLNAAYSRFVPRQFLQFLNKNSIVDVQLGNHVEREMSVLFSDIRSFTTLSESMNPQDNFKFINSYLRRMEPAILLNNGFIDKYIGDAIMALFGESADDAVEAGIDMLHRLREYNQHRANCDYEPIQIGIGINTGTLMLGTVGGYNRMDSTVISDAVNLASRLEGLTKNYGVALLISHQTFLRLENRDRYIIRQIDTVQVKGKSQRVTVYEVCDGDLPHLRDAKQATLDIFATGLSLFNQQNYEEAAQKFAECLRQNPGDRVAQIYWQRCQHSGAK